MEMYGVVIINIESEQDIQNLQNKIDEMSEEHSGNKFDFEKVKHNSTQALLQFMSDSSGSMVLDDLFAYFAEENLPFAKASIIGDEDPFINLYWIDNGDYYQSNIESSRYEYLSEADEDELDEDDLAFLSNPKKTILEDYKLWKKGIVVIESFNEINSIVGDVIDSVIEDCESMVE
jgi:hypothetical protein|tara:strand:- start:226 stop:753 length:528 start_codon:yes stop_codon:yes gene_type:complete